MSDPNAAIKNRQTLILGGVVTSVLGLVVAGMFLFDGDAPKARVKPTIVAMTAPGNVDDKDAWRASESAKSNENQKRLEEMQQKMKAQEEQNKRLEKTLEDIKSGKTATPAPVPLTAAVPSVPASSPVTGPLPRPAPVTPAQAGATLNQPLGFPAKPGQVLGSPNAPAGQPGTLNQPLNGSAPQAPAREVVEIISFGRPAEAKPGAPGASAPQQGDPDVLGFPTNERAKRMASAPEGRPGASSANAVEFIPAGSFVRVAMLNGVDAPTGGQAQSNPLPMAFQVLDTANLANKYRLDIKDCRFIAAAYGDLSSERTMGRTESLTCIINGDTVEMPVKGTVIGEDGKAGMRGRLVTKQGQLLANALFAGSLSGIGRAFQQSATTQAIGGGGVVQTIDPSRVGTAAIGGGVGSASNMLATYYLKAADKLFPVIETDGGRVVEILITKGAVYKGGAVKRDQYKSLLRRSGATSRTHDEED